MSVPSGWQPRLNASDVAAPGNQPLSYTATIHAKKLGGLRRAVGEADGMIPPAETFTVDIAGMVLPEGLYRLQAAVNLTLPSAGSESHSEITSLLEGGPFQVY